MKYLCTYCTTQYYSLTTPQKGYSMILLFKSNQIKSVVEIHFLLLEICFWATFHSPILNYVSFNWRSHTLLFWLNFSVKQANRRFFLTTWHDNLDSSIFFFPLCPHYMSYRQVQLFSSSDGSSLGQSVDTCPRKIDRINI